MMIKIKVLHIIMTLDLGGAEMNLFNLVTAFGNGKSEHHLAYSGHGEMEDKFVNAGIKLYCFDDKTHKLRSRASFKIILRLSDYIKENDIQIVHTHTFNAHVWGSIAAKLTGRKIVEHVHDPRYEPPGYLSSIGLPESPQLKIAPLFAKLSNIIVVLTSSNKEYLVKNGIAGDEKVRIILNGIDLNVAQKKGLDEIKNKYNIPPEKKVIMTAMRLSPEKNATFIIDIAAAMNPLAQDLIFVIAGNGPLKGDLEKKAKVAGLEEKVRFLGYVSDMDELLAVTDIFILPTLRELHSISMIEAMNRRLPVLVSRSAGCNGDLISDGLNGFLLDPKEPTQWASTIEDLITNEERRKFVGGKGRELVEKECDIHETAKKFEELYLSLVKQCSN